MIEQPLSIGGDTLSDRLQPLADMSDALPQMADGRLLGSRCADCQALAFPARNVCMGCGGRDLAVEALPPRGSLYSFTTVHVSSARPTPYSIGYIDLEGGTRLLATIQGQQDLLQVDAPVALHIDGDQWTFVPETMR